MAAHGGAGAGNGKDAGHRLAGLHTEGRACPLPSRHDGKGAGRGLAGLPHVPAVAGCYALLLRVDAPRPAVIGALGRHAFAPGWYVYCGSAQGSGGLRARVGRHLRPSAVRRWHVDYLRQIATVAAAWLWPKVPRMHECALAAALAALPGATRPLSGFGSSDCRCPGHLIALQASGVTEAVDLVAPAKIWTPS